MNERTRRRKQIVLPWMVLPFLTIIFWSLGGGSGNSTANDQGQQGLNTKLPAPDPKSNRLEDKLAFYNKASKDSAKRKEWMRYDPYYKEELGSVAPGAGEPFLETSSFPVEERKDFPNLPKANLRTREEELHKKLALLQKGLNDTTVAKKQAAPSHPKNRREKTSNEFSTEVDRLEAMMQMIQGGSGDHSELQQMDAVMDKILDIQHPERVSVRMRNQSRKEQANQVLVSVGKGAPTIGLLDSGIKKKEYDPFYGVDRNRSVPEPSAVKAEVYGDQTVKGGSVVKLRLLNDISVNSRLVPKGTLVFGSARLVGERLDVDITAIRHETVVIPVKLQLYDLDGLEGIAVTGTLSGEAVRNATVNGNGILQIPPMDQSLKAQAMAAGVNTARTLLTKKVKLVKIKLKSGYRVLLKG